MELHKPYLFVNERKGQLLKIDDYKFIRIVCSLIKTMMDLIMNRGREKKPATSVTILLVWELEVPSTLGFRFYYSPL